MREIVSSIGRVLDIVCWIALAIGCIGLVAMTLAVAWQVFGRFILNDTPSWTEPISLLLMLYFILLVAAVGVRERFHLGLDLFRLLLPARVLLVMEIINFTLLGFFGCAMFWFGREMIMQSWGVPMVALGFPEGVALIPMSLSGLMIILFSIEQILRLILGMGLTSAVEGNE